MTLEEVKIQFPSKCWDCVYSRRPAAESNLEEGWTGCCIRAVNEFWDHDAIQVGQVGEGWVDLKSEPEFGIRSGVITNFQLLTRQVSDCLKYQIKT